MKAAAIGLVFLLGVSGFAQEVPPEAPPVLELATVLRADGKVTWPVAIHHMAVGFALERAHHHVRITARLGNGGGRAEVDAFLMREIGPDATEGDEVARTMFELSYPFDGWVDLFNDLELEKGTYWLVLGKPKDSTWSSINWFAAQPAVGTSACNAHLTGSQSFTFESDAADYLPASKFVKKYTPYAFQIEITELRPPGAAEICTWQMPAVNAGTGSSR
ncbi:MAG TPA: hypothetical protein VF432_23820 [Thermoanaerobaculia bacterium]